jgi:hypothetical protein
MMIIRSGKIKHGETTYELLYNTDTRMLTLMINAQEKPMFGSADMDDMEAEFNGSRGEGTISFLRSTLEIPRLPGRQLVTGMAKSFERARAEGELT